MDSVCIKDIFVDSNEEVKVKIDINNSGYYVYIDVDRDEGAYISELFLDVDMSDKYSDIYDLYIDSINKRNLNIHSILLTITEVECYANIIFEKYNEKICDDTNISIGVGIIIGLKSKKPIFMNTNKSEAINMNILNPKDFEF